MSRFECCGLIELLPSPVVTYLQKKQTVRSLLVRACLLSQSLLFHTKTRLSRVLLIDALCLARYQYHE